MFGWVVDVLVDTVAVRVATIVVFLSVGVFLANVAVAAGAVDRIARVSKHLTEPANLPREVGTAIVTTTASPTAGYGMLAEYRSAGALDDRATLVAVTINTFFGWAQHILTFYAPVLIPIVGLKVGVVYVGARGLVALAITATGVLAGAALLSEGNVDRDALARVVGDEGESGDEESKGNGESDDGRDDAQDDDGSDDEQTGYDRAVAVSRTALAETRERLREIVPRLVVVYAVVALAVARQEWIVERVTGLFGAEPAAVSEPLALATGLLGLPAEAVPVVAVFAVDTTNGAIVIAPLIEAGTFTTRTAVATMLIGGIVSFAVSTFKRSIPFQYGIWGASFGSKVIVVNTALKLVFLTVALAVLLV